MYFLFTDMTSLQPAFQLRYLGHVPQLLRYCVKIAAKESWYLLGILITPSFMNRDTTLLYFMSNQGTAPVEWNLL